MAEEGGARSLEAMTTSYGCRYSAGRLYPPADAPTTPPAVDPEQRIGDAERERASTELRAQFTAGRLDVEEFSARLDEVWAATTAGDLQRVMRDLPPPQPVAGPPPVWEA